MTYACMRATELAFVTCWHHNGMSIEAATGLSLALLACMMLALCSRSFIGLASCCNQHVALPRQLTAAYLSTHCARSQAAYVAVLSPAHINSHVRAQVVCAATQHLHHCPIICGGAHLKKLVKTAWCRHKATRQPGCSRSVAAATSGRVHANSKQNWPHNAPTILL